MPQNSNREFVLVASGQGSEGVAVIQSVSQSVNQSVTCAALDGLILVQHREHPKQTGNHRFNSDVHDAIGSCICCNERGREGVLSVKASVMKVRR